MMCITHLLIFLQLAQQVIAQNQYWLSINVNVALWLDCRTFNNNSPLQIVSNFVLVTSKIHEKFDDFVRKENSDTSLLPSVKLLQFWETAKGITLSTVSRYGKRYAELNGEHLDDLCQWVEDMRQ